MSRATKPGPRSGGYGNLRLGGGYGDLGGGQFNIGANADGGLIIAGANGVPEPGFFVLLAIDVIGLAAIVSRRSQIL